MPEVLCNCDCYFNDEGSCIKEEIEVNDSGECIDQADD